MQTKFADGSVMVAGRSTRDAELRHTQSGKKVTSFSIVVGKAKDTTTIFVDISAWDKLAEYAQKVTKGDAVCAIGTITEREYNGKQYKTLNCDWLNVASADGNETPQVVKPTIPKRAVDVQFEELTDDPNDLPFNREL